MYGQETAVRNAPEIRLAEVPSQVEQLQALAKSLHETVAHLEEPLPVPLAQVLHDVLGDYGTVEARISLNR